MTQNPSKPAEPAAANAGDVDLDDLARAMRGALASLRAAAETIELFPAMDAGQRGRLHGVVAEETERLGRLVDRLEELTPSEASGAFETLDPDALLGGLCRALGEKGLDVERIDGAIDGAPRLRADRRLLESAARDFAAVLRRDFATLRCRVSALEIDGHLLLDWSWRPEPGAARRLQDWLGRALDGGLRPAVRRHGGEAWFDLDRADAPRAHVRLLLPLLADARSPERRSGR